MSLANIFEMAKADRYTADGREEFAKAREADVEDRTYNIGEISQKTGLQKTANGWVKPPKGKAAPANKAESINKTWSKSDVVSSVPRGWKKAEGVQTVPNGYVAVTNGKPRFGEGGREVKLVKQEEFEKSSGGSKASGKASNEKELRHILETSGYGERKGDSESKPSGMSAEQRKKWADKAANSSETKASLANFIKSMEGNKANPHAEEIVKIYKDELKKREENPRYRPEKLYDSAPRVLTGDCKVRVRK